MKPNFYRNLTLSAFAVASLSLGTAIAAPYYVGENPTPENSIYLGFKDAPTKSTATTSSGNIAAFDINLMAATLPYERFALLADLPFFMASKNATGVNKSETNFGNVELGLNFNNSMSRTSDYFRWGYMVGVNGYLPTARSREALVVSRANPTIDFYRYQTSASTIAPQVGWFASQNHWSVKTNVGYAFTYLDKNSVAAGDNNRQSAIWQAGLSFHPAQNLNLSAEYNTIYLDTKTAAGRGRFRHAVSPSISGRANNVVGNLYATIPVDATTRDIVSVAFGVNAGLSF